MNTWKVQQEDYRARMARSLYGPLLDGGDDDGDDHDGDEDDPRAEEREQYLAELAEEEEEEPRPRVIDFRPSPGSRLSPEVRPLVDRYLPLINACQNYHRGAEYHHDLNERILRSRCLTAPGEFEVALAAWRAQHALVVTGMLAVTPETPRDAFIRTEHDVRDLEIVAVLVGLHPDLIHEDWGQRQIWHFKYELVAAPDSPTGSRWETSAHRKHFYGCRDAMRARDPDERARARERDRRYSRSKKGKETKAKYRATPEAKAKDAARKRAARAEKKKLEKATETQKET